MTDYVAPVGTALFAWWFATGLILYLVRRPPPTFRWSLAAAAAIAAVALIGLVATREQTTAAAAYLAFGCGLALWGFLELGFLTGLITGRRRGDSSAPYGSWRHFVHAIEAILHHELAIIATAIVVLAIGWGAPNPVGAWTFLVLWVMRQSAKLNLYLGVRNPGVELLPPHLEHLKRYFRRRPINLLFPLSVTAPEIVVALLVEAALAPHAGSFEVAGHLLVATLLALAVLEHWLLVLPVSLDRLWRWAMNSRQSAAGKDVEAPQLRLDSKFGIF